jgi:hypothetical protein
VADGQWVVAAGEQQLQQQVFGLDFGVGGGVHVLNITQNKNSSKYV